MQCAVLVTCQITLFLSPVAIPQLHPLPAFGSISTHFVTPPILVTGTPVFSPFSLPPATSPGRWKNSLSTDLRLQMQVLGHEHPQYLVEVPDPPEVQRGRIVPHLVPGLCHHVFFQRLKSLINLPWGKEQRWDEGLAPLSSWKECGHPQCQRGSLQHPEEECWWQKEDDRPNLGSQIHFWMIDQELIRDTLKIVLPDTLLVERLKFLSIATSRSYQSPVLKVFDNLFIKILIFPHQLRIPASWKTCRQHQSGRGGQIYQFCKKECPLFVISFVHIIAKMPMANIGAPNKINPNPMLVQRHADLSRRFPPTPLCWKAWPRKWSYSGPTPMQQNLPCFPSPSPELLSHRWSLCWSICNNILKTNPKQIEFGNTTSWYSTLSDSYLTNASSPSKNINWRVSSGLWKAKQTYKRWRGWVVFKRIYLSHLWFLVLQLSTHCVGHVQHPENQLSFWIQF